MNEGGERKRLRCCRAYARVNHRQRERCESTNTRACVRPRAGVDAYDFVDASGRVRGCHHPGAALASPEVGELDAGCEDAGAGAGGANARIARFG
jgi:hypothetical protein